MNLRQLIPTADLRDGSVTSRLLSLRVRIPPRARMSFSSECYMPPMRQADPSFRGVQPSVVCLSVIRRST